MRSALLVFFCLIGWIFVYAQKISYTIPEGYESKVSKEEYRKIADMAVAVIAKRYAIDFVKDGTVQLKKGQDMQAFNLHNLIEKCVAVKDKSLWNKVIQDHFDNLFAFLDEQKKIDPNNFETVKKYLSLRIYTQRMVEQRGGAQNLIDLLR